MKTLAIHGHPTRGREVIEILEMLGGKNISNIKGNYTYLYYIGDNNFISLTDNYRNDFIIFTLEEFLEKYPYKVGDKVLLDNQVKIIKGVGWDSKNNEIIYTLETNINGVNTQYQVFNYDLQPYKEELKKERKYPELRMDPSDDDKLAIEVAIGEDKILPPNGYLIGKITDVDNGLLVELVKKQPQYPKTYNECYEIMNIPENKFIQCGTYGYKAGLLSKFQELLICRDAYWKIADNWKPYWNNDTQFKFIITYRRDNIIKDTYTAKNCILAFPTEEMRDIFLENFKNLIEKCKEFL